MKTKDCIFYLFSSAARAGTRFWAAEITELGITPAQGMVLAFLGEQDRITSALLGKRVQLDSATLTGIIDRLVSAELVERQPNPDDRRAILVCLTDQGKKVCRRIDGIIETANRRFLSHLTVEEAMILKSLLRKVTADPGE